MLIIVGGSDRGLLYGVFALLRFLATDADLTQLNFRSHPAMPIRWVDEWDNPDGSIERGYAGRSIFFETGSVRDDLAPVPSTPACCLGGHQRLQHQQRQRRPATARLHPPEADRPHRRRPCVPGRSSGLSVDVASPQKIGGLSTYDPLGSRCHSVVDRKTKESMSLSRLRRLHGEGRLRRPAGPPATAARPPTPQTFWQTRSAPHGASSVLLPRPSSTTTTRLAADPRPTAPAPLTTSSTRSTANSPPTSSSRSRKAPSTSRRRSRSRRLFAGLRQTSQAMEVQVTQEYTGQQRHLVYLAPMGSRFSTSTCAPTAAQRHQGDLGREGLQATFGRHGGRRRSGPRRVAWLTAGHGQPLRLRPSRLGSESHPEQIAAEWTPADD